MWSWLGFPAKTAEELEDEKLFEKNLVDVKQVYIIGDKIAAGVFGTVYQVNNLDVASYLLSDFTSNI